jgi:hypothetical protein
VASAKCLPNNQINLKFLFWRGGKKKRNSPEDIPKDSSCPFTQKILWKNTKKSSGKQFFWENFIISESNISGV